MLTIGSIVDDRYKIIKILGRGGTSCVYLAQSVRLLNYWAIKEVYKGNVIGPKRISNTLIAESQILTKLRHPGLPAIVDVIETYSSFLLVMEYIQGITLDKLLEQRGAQSEEQVRRWGIQLCDVLQYLHEQQPSIIYRDMKPSNVIVKPDGNIVLIDLGMARELKKSGADTGTLGTHGYAAPEQYDENRRSDARTDVYGLGMTLYHLVTGQNPCVSSRDGLRIRQHNPNVSYELEQIILRCIEYAPEKRYQSAVQLKESLEKSEDYEEEKRGGSKIWLAIIIPIIVIGLLIAVALAVSSKQGVLSYIDNLGMTNDYMLPWAEQVVEIEYPEDVCQYEFTPYVSGQYTFYANCDNGAAPVTCLYDENDELIASDNLYGEYSDTYLSCWLEEGRTYYLQTTLYYLDPTYPNVGKYIIYAELEQ